MFNVVQRRGRVGRRQPGKVVIFMADGKALKRVKGIGERLTESIRRVIEVRYSGED